MAIPHDTPNRHAQVAKILLLSIFAVSSISIAFPESASAAITLGAPSWVQVPSSSTTFYLSGGGGCTDASCEPPTCTPISVTLDGFSQYQFNQAGTYYTDAACTTLYSPTHFKTALCGAGQVMVGTRDYQYTHRVDDEHVDAYCATVSGATVGSTRGVYSAPNSGSTLWGGYKEAYCPAGQVMTGTRMYGYYPEVDDEYIDAGCSTFSASLGTAQWVSAPNAFTTLNGGYKQAVCPSGQVMVGTRWYEYNQNIDDEHTDALCAPIVQPPPAEPVFSASCAYQSASATYSITYSWTGVADAVNYPVRLRGPSHATGDSPAYAIGTSGGADVVGWGVANDAPTASGFAFTGLTAAGDYTYWGHAWNANGWSTHTDRIVTCTAPAPTASAPTVSTKAISSITQTSAASGGTIVSDGGATVTVSGIVWSTSSNPTTSLSTKTTNGWATGGPWTSNLTGLTAGTTYYVRAYATNSAGTSYGANVSFTTSAAAVANSAPLGYLDTADCSNITGWAYDPDVPSSSISVVLYRDGSSSTGTLIGRYTTDTTRSDVNSSYGITGTHGYSITVDSSFKTGTSHSVYVYAIDSAGGTDPLTRGSPKTITCTAAASAPTVSTKAISSITQTSAASGGTIVSDGGATVTVSGIVWSTSSNPTTSLSTKTTNGWATGGPWTSNLTGLTAGTTYYVRAYATNSAGTSYGANVSFTTSAAADCTATTINNCSLPATASGSSSGSCSSGYAGSCNYSCSNGGWTPGSNSCVVSTAPSITASQSSCTIASGANSCSVGTVTLNWNFGSTGVALREVEPGVPSYQISTQSSATNYAVTPKYSYSEFWVLDKDGFTVASTKVDAVCASGTTWSTSSNTCVASSCPASYTDTSVTGKAGVGAVVWGSSPYTDDSDLSYAAVHAGLIAAGQNAIIRRTSAGLVASYTGSTQNGVTTADWDSFCGVTLSLVNTTPTATLTASPNTITSGQSSTLTWNSTNATSCTSAGGFSTGNATSNSTGVSVSPSVTSTYQITCTGPSGSASANRTVTVTTPTLTISASPARLTKGSSATITWNATNVKDCDITRNGASWKTNLKSNGSKILNGSSSNSITTQTTYVMTCTDVSGNPFSGTATTIVNIVPAFQEF